VRGRPQSGRSHRARGGRWWLASARPSPVKRCSTFASVRRCLRVTESLRPASCLPGSIAAGGVPAATLSPAPVLASLLRRGLPSGHPCPLPNFAAVSTRRRCLLHPPVGIHANAPVRGPPRRLDNHPQKADDKSHDMPNVRTRTHGHRALARCIQQSLSRLHRCHHAGRKVGAYPAKKDGEQAISQWSTSPKVTLT